MNNKVLIQKLFYQILCIRMVEEAIADRYKEQEMRCPIHLCLGQEAIAVGVCANLKKDDLVMSAHRAHGHYLAKGGDLKKMIAELYGKETGCSNGRGGSQHLIDLSVNFLGATPIVAQTIPIAVGVGFATKMNQESGISVVFFGEAALEEGVAHEAINFAVLKKLPVLFVCENNLYSVNTPLSERQPKRAMHELSAGHGIRVYHEDGNDIMKVYTVTQKMLPAIRKGDGPAFIEFATYRYREHCGPNPDHPQIRERNEVERWYKKDPIMLAQKRFLADSVLDRVDIDRMKEKISEEIDDAFEFAKKSPFPSGGISEEQVYA